MTRHRSRRPAVLAGAAAVAAVVVAGPLLSGCTAEQPAAAGASTSTPTPWTVESEPQIRPGDAVPAPTGPVVLTITGGTVTNVGDELQLDLATIDRMGTVRYAVFDRQAEGRRVVFSGPLLRTVLAVAGAQGTTMHTVALNDYAVDIPVKDTERYPVLLATRADGTRMTVEHYGPTRVVYPTKGFDLDKTVYDPRWIWQLATIDVR